MNVINNALSPYYQQSPPFRKNCLINSVYQTLPENPVGQNPYSYPTEWENVAYGPTSVKHLYTGIPNYYPYQKIKRPVGTLYDHDYSLMEAHNLGGKRVSYHYKIYPHTNIFNREVRSYSDDILPYMDIRNWTKYPIERGDASLNSSLQKHPYASGHF